MTLNRRKSLRRGRPQYYLQNPNPTAKDDGMEISEFIRLPGRGRRRSSGQRFGKTYWGKQWLNALSNIDHDNRLPRGRSYALKGAVQKIGIIGNKILAEVSGSSPRPYHVKITIPEFNVHQKEKLTKLFQSKLEWIAGLYNKNLSSELISETKKIGVELFPITWKDFEMNCNCPDSAVPCKHIAAVIYLSSEDIDLNPVAIFDLRNFNIRNVFYNQRPVAQKDEHEFEEVKLIEVKKKKIRSTGGDFAVTDYSKIQPFADEVMKLLPESTPFASYKFKSFCSIYLTSPFPKQNDFCRCPSPNSILLKIMNLVLSKSMIRFLLLKSFARE